MKCKGQGHGNHLTKFQEDIAKKNVELSVQKMKFHEDWHKNMTSEVFTKLLTRV